MDELLEIVAGFHPGPLADYARSFAETDLRAVLPAVGVPTLVVQAGSDVRSPMEVGQALHTAIPGAELAVLDGVGHVSNMEAPAVFDAAVLRFVSSVEA